MARVDEKPDWGKIAFHAGILREGGLDKNRLALWLPAERVGGYQYWHRISSIADAGIVRREKLFAIAAASIKARQPLRSFLGSLKRRFRRDNDDNKWMLPNGEEAEQCEGRKSGLLLVGTEDDSNPLDEAKIRKVWPHIGKVQSLGPRIALLWGAPAEDKTQEPLPTDGPTTTHDPLPTDEPTTTNDPLPTDVLSARDINRRLADARSGGDLAGEVSALSDLGLLAFEDGDMPKAVAVLEEAATKAGSLGDKAPEGEALGNLGLVLLSHNRLEKARQVLGRSLQLVHSSGDRFAEKLVLERLGSTEGNLGNMPGAVELLTQALALARELGDRQHEADLLWHLSIRHADFGRREQALEYGQTAVRLMDELGKSYARTYRDHLEKYRAGEAAQGRRAMPSNGEAASLNAPPDGSTVGGPASPADRAGPGYLRMAISAGKALAQFIGSGMKTVGEEMLNDRLRKCVACEYHTGLRCRVCGCFCKLKAQSPHEDCPKGRWPIMV
jgi:tetratricopeptide (TPR) repeat protein